MARHSMQTVIKKNQQIKWQEKMINRDEEEARFAFNMIQAANQITGIILIALYRKDTAKAEEIGQMIKSQNLKLVLQVQENGLNLFAFDQHNQPVGGPLFSFAKEDAPAGAMN